MRRPSTPCGATRARTAPVYRYSGMSEREGAFLVCSFWLVEALARGGRVDEAAEAMDELVGLGNVSGSIPGRSTPTMGSSRANCPQALTHLGLVNAASAFDEASAER